jgi:RNA polymerase sigma-70 factor (ECF subfamily)
MSRATDGGHDAAVHERSLSTAGPFIETVSGRSRPRELAELIHRSATGDQEAFVDLYDATCSRVYGLGVRILQSPPWAEEIARESYLEVWRSSARFDESECSAVGWILSIMLRRVADRLSSSSQPGLRPHRVPAPSLADLAGRRRRVTRAEAELVEALARLHRDQRAALQRACRAADETESDRLTTVLTTLVTAKLARQPADDEPPG